MNFLEHWQLCERPFESTWDTRYFFASPAHEEALERLWFLAGEQTMNMGLLTGEIGCGKTLTRAVFTSGLDPKRFRVVVQEYAAFGFRDLLGSILTALEGRPPRDCESKLTRYQRFKSALGELRAEGQHLILLIDEAQEMSARTLNELKLLTNFNGDGRNYLSVILLGQPELRQRIAELPALEQRISLRFHLSALRPAEARAYLQHRLRVAGHSTGDLFGLGAIDRAFELSRGVPRELNRLGKLALELAWLRDLPEISAQAVEAVARDLERQQTLRAA